ncbi:MAG: hypothetical protein DPW09_03030 [Anaerolineae bacterium]|nr:hypothetical protein [Anaerolineae bacterium]
MTIHDELIGFFHRHLVPIFFTFEKEKDIQNFVVTAFVLSVLDQWFLITAGHCIREIEKLTDSYGYKIVGCQLIDFLGLGATNQRPIPFVYEGSHPTCLSDNYAFDYGVMVLSGYYKKLLQANNIQALNEEVWKKQPNKVDLYMLLGIPAELVKVDPDIIEIVPTLHTIESVSQKPDGFTETDAPLFYGKIALNNDLKSIKGMSGGPIFAFSRNEQGELRYWLTALQSRWLPETHFIAACPTNLLGHFLESITLQINQD